MLYGSRVAIATRGRSRGDEVSDVNKCTTIIGTILILTRLTYIRSGLVYFSSTYPKTIGRVPTFLLQLCLNTTFNLSIVLR
jgi:hypothetical protein